jgi:hypothetical protein
VPLRSGVPPSAGAVYRYRNVLHRQWKLASIAPNQSMNVAGSTTKSIIEANRIWTGNQLRRACVPQDQNPTPRYHDASSCGSHRARNRSTPQNGDCPFHLSTPRSVGFDDCPLDSYSVCATVHSYRFCDRHNSRTYRHQRLLKNQRPIEKVRLATPKMNSVCRS